MFSRFGYSPLTDLFEPPPLCGMSGDVCDYYIPPYFVGIVLVFAVMAVFFAVKVLHSKTSTSRRKIYGALLGLSIILSIVSIGCIMAKYTIEKQQWTEYVERRHQNCERINRENRDGDPKFGGGAEIACEY